MVEVNLGNNRGLRGSKGISGFEAPRIVSNERISRVGSLDTYVITLEDGKTYTYTVRNNSEQASSFCQALVDAYSTYTLTLSETEITTVTGDVTIIATLKANDTPLVNKTVGLYDGSTLVSTETTNNAGVVTFNTIINTDTLFTVNYDDKVTATCTVYYKPYTFPLDGTDGIRGSGLSTGDGVLTLSHGATGALTDFYIDNNGLWEVSCEIYANEDNWRLVLYPKGVSNKYYGYHGYPNKGVWKTESINGYTTIDLGADFKLPFQRWFEFKLKKTSSNTVEITVDGNITTITDNRLVYNSYLEFGVYGWQSLTNYIRHIRLDPAIPNE